MYQIHFILEWHSACFGWSFRPSSGVQDCTYSNRHLSNRYCCLLASKQTAVSVWQMPVPVRKVLKSWWWTERPPKHVERHFKIKYIWYIGASSWFYYRNDITIHSPMNVKHPFGLRRFSVYVCKSPEECSWKSACQPLRLNSALLNRLDCLFKLFNLSAA